MPISDFLLPFILLLVAGLIFLGGTSLFSGQSQNIASCDPPLPPWKVVFCRPTTVTSYWYQGKEADPDLAKKAGIFCKEWCKNEKDVDCKTAVEKVDAVPSGEKATLIGNLPLVGEKIVYYKCTVTKKV